jgi:hypothetical protein
MLRVATMIVVSGLNCVVTGIHDIIKQLEEYKRALESALRALHQPDGAEAPNPAQTPRISAGRRRQIEAMRQYWAKKKATAANKGARKESHRGGITPAGRKRLSEVMRKRWAAKRAG